MTLFCHEVEHDVASAPTLKISCILNSWGKGMKNTKSMKNTKKLWDVMFGISATIIAAHAGTATAMTDGELKSITEQRLFLRATADAARWGYPAEKMSATQLQASACTYALMSQFDLKVFGEGGP